MIRIYDGRGDDKPLLVVDKVHRFPVHTMTVSANLLAFDRKAKLLTRTLEKFNDRYNTVISADENGFLEYWQPFEPFESPKNDPRMWDYKSSTDLFEFKKVKKCFLRGLPRN